jgi:hypothetical protein
MSFDDKTRAQRPHGFVNTRTVCASTFSFSPYILKKNRGDISPPFCHHAVQFTARLERQENDPVAGMADIMHWTRTWLVGPSSRSCVLVPQNRVFSASVTIEPMDTAHNSRINVWEHARWCVAHGKPTDMSDTPPIAFSFVSPSPHFHQEECEAEHSEHWLIAETQQRPAGPSELCEAMLGCCHLMHINHNRMFSKLGVVTCIWLHKEAFS